MKRGDLFQARKITERKKDADGNKTMYQWQGAKRPPAKGEHYLSGAAPEAYVALADLSTPYYIVVPVKVRETIVRKVVSMDDKKKEYKGYSLALKLNNESVAPWDDKKHYHYIFSVSRGDTASTFDFYGSHQDYKDENPGAVDPCEVFLMVVSDALSYIQSSDIDDFQSNFAYEECSKLIKAWEGCKKAARDLAELGLNEDDLCNIADGLSEIGDGSQ